MFTSVVSQRLHYCQTSFSQRSSNTAAGLVMQHTRLPEGACWEGNLQDPLLTPTVEPQDLVTPPHPVPLTLPPILCFSLHTAACPCPITGKCTQSGCERLCCSTTCCNPSLFHQYCVSACIPPCVPSNDRLYGQSCKRRVTCAILHSSIYLSHCTSVGKPHHKYHVDMRSMPCATFQLLAMQQQFDMALTTES